MQGKKNGFTLVEVLVASVIFFTVISSVTLGYQAAISAERASEKTARIVAIVPLVFRDVRERIRTNPESRLSASGVVRGVSFDFAAVSRVFSPPQPSFNIDNGELITFQPRYRLYDVSLRLELEGYTKHFKYTELAWSRDLQVAASQ